ncbi:MAG: Dabb family protein [Candidatus Howiella sp.]
MLKHVVCFKLKDNSPKACEKARDVLLSMKGRVPLLRDISVGIDLLHSDRSYDVVLEVLLDDLAALEAYQNDPYHCCVVKAYMHEVREASIAIDYLFGGAAG